MKKMWSTREMRSEVQKGFTLIELLVVISIIGLLASVVLANLNSARGKGRYARVIADMREIAQAAQVDYDSRGTWAQDTGPGGAPAFVPAYLSAWPSPPCSNWTYDWDYWGSDIRITVVVMPPVSAANRRFYYCIETAGNCALGSGGSPFEIPIQSYNPKTITCNE